jgi:hypothetical protein
MTHPFRHDLEAALARIDQLESALADSKRPSSLSEQLWQKVRTPLMVSTVIGSLIGGVGFSTLLVSHMDDEETADLGLAADIAEAHTAVRTQIVTVSPRGISALQVQDIASSKAADLNAACAQKNAVVEPVGVTLDLDVTSDGAVSRAQARGPAELARCTENAAKTWSFPPADGTTHASIPLYFRPNLATGARVLNLPQDAKHPQPEQETGTLAVACMPACDAVLEDGVPLGHSPILAHPSTVGRHVIELISGTTRHTVYTHVYPRQLAEIREDLTDTPDPETLAPL